MQWKDGDEEFVLLKLLKESNTIEVAEYSEANDASDEPAFAHWVPHALRKRNRILSAVNARIKQASHKYGIEVLMSVDHAQRADTANGNRHWMDAIDKEMKQVIVDFEILEKGTKAPV